MILAFMMSIFCGLNAGAVVVDVEYHHTFMVFVNAAAAVLCLRAAMRGAPR